MSSILGHTITIGSPLIINPSTPSSTLQAAHAPRLYRLVARGRLALCVKWLRYLKAMTIAFWGYTTNVLLENCET